MFEIERAAHSYACPRMVLMYPLDSVDEDDLKALGPSFGGSWSAEELDTAMRQRLRFHNSI